MIFSESTTIDVGPVAESQYDLGITGALMHVYENECNYNAILKSAGISESKYYAETGGDLFVQEAGALKGLGQKFVAFFKKVIEKIKAIGKKFLAKINQYALNDEKFVKKYESELKDKSSIISNMEFDGYKFPMTDISIEENANIIAPIATNILENEDEVEKQIETNRSKIIGENKCMDLTEFRATIKEKLYGDKDFSKVNITEQLKYIKDKSKDVKDAKNKENKAITSVSNMIKEIEKNIQTARDSDSRSDQDKSNVITNWNTRIKICKDYSNDITTAYGAYVKALVDRSRQAKAICVKALSYKHEAATMEGAYSDLFSDVEII